MQSSKFYTLDEALAVLKREYSWLTRERLAKFVEEGEIRGFLRAGELKFRQEEIDAIVGHKSLYGE